MSSLFTTLRPMPVSSSITRFLAAAAILAAACTHVLDGERSSPLVRRSIALLRSGDTLGAVAVLEGVSSESASPEAAELLASIYRARGTIQGRLLAQKTLERALQRYPDSAGLQLELGLTYYEQGFYPDAVRILKRVVQRDPSNCRALFLLGKNHLRRWRRNQQYIDHLRKAGLYFSRARHCDSSSWEISFYLAFTRYALGDTSGALEECTRGEMLWPENPKFPLLAGLASFDLGEYDRAEAEFEKGLSMAGPELRDKYEDISSLLWGKSLEKYREAGPRERKEMERIYWLERDPDPTTPLNERRLEHLARMTEADLYFSDEDIEFSGSPGDRGTALVKFGWPRKILYDAGEGLSGRLENWVYGSEEDRFHFVFVDEYLNDRFSIPFQAEEMKRELLDRNNMSPIESLIVNLPGRLNVYTFADSAAAIAVFYSALVYPPSGRDPPGPSDSRWILRGVLYDYQWREYERFTPAYDMGFVPGPGDSCIYVAGKLSLPFDNFHIAVAVEDSSSQARAVMRREIHGIEYLGDSLLLSDVVLHASGDSGGPARIDRGGISMTPRIGSSFRRGEKLGIYFEVYNLRRKGGLSNYETTVMIYRARERKHGDRFGLSAIIRNSLGLESGRTPVISQTFSGSGPGASANLSLSIDISDLEGGDYELEVSIMDVVSGQRSKRTVLFHLVSES